MEWPQVARVAPKRFHFCNRATGLICQSKAFQKPGPKACGNALRTTTVHLEIASVALKKHKQGLNTLAVTGLARYDALEIALYRIESARVLALALRYKLSACDAAYLWLAAELKAPLATFDEKLAAAAQTHLASLP